jgi:DNA polymerase elongation subunit (family B)
MSTYAFVNSTVSRIKNKDTLIIWGKNTQDKTTKSFGVQKLNPYFYVSDSDGVELNCYGQPIRKINCSSVNDYYNKKRQYKDCKLFNSDIPLDMQYLIDKKIVYGFDDKLNPVDVSEPIEPHVIYYDIELNIPVGERIDDTLNKYPIVAIAVLDNYTGDNKVFTIGEIQVHPQQVVCKNEEELLKTFFIYIQTTNPDIIAGWNSQEFDLPYIINRACIYNIPTNQLNRVNAPVNDKHMLIGRTHVDMMDLYKLWNKPNGQLPSYGLKYVAKHVDNFEYEAYGSKIQTLIANNDWHTIVEYNLNDVVALHRINNKCKLIVFYENLRRLCGIKFEDTTKNTKIIEILLLRHGIKPIPPLRKHTTTDLEGAYVKQPTIGIKHNVATYDAASLYPSIIIAKNLSPDIDKMIPKTITYILNEREKYRAIKLSGKSTLSDETTEQSLKYIANSFYGACASQYFKLYDIEIASTITRTGREILSSMEKDIMSLGYNVVYADTDGSFVENVESLSDAEKIKTHINIHLKRWAKDNNIPEQFAPFVKFEKWFSCLFFKKKSGSEDAAKKNYVGRLVYKDGKVKDELSYTGIGVKRSDTAPYTKEVMEEFFKLVLIEDNITDAVQLVKNSIEDIKQQRVDLHKIAVPKGVKSLEGTGAYQKGCKIGTELFNIKYTGDKKPKLVYCISPYPQVCIDDEITTEEVLSKVAVDWAKMADVVIAQKFRSLIESIGVSWDTMNGQQKLF